MATWGVPAEHGRRWSRCSKHYQLPDLHQRWDGSDRWHRWPIATALFLSSLKRHILWYCLSILSVYVCHFNGANMGKWMQMIISNYDKTIGLFCFPKIWDKLGLEICYSTSIFGAYGSWKFQVTTVPSALARSPDAGDWPWSSWDPSRRRG